MNHCVTWYELSLRFARTLHHTTNELPLLFAPNLQTNFLQASLTVRSVVPTNYSNALHAVKHARIYTCTVVCILQVTEQSFGMWNICIHTIVCKVDHTKKKERKKERR